MAKYLDENGLSFLWNKTKSELNNKVDNVSGKGLSTNDYTTTEKNKLAGIANNANNYTHSTTAGNKHIPAGGSSSQILGYGGANGTAAWITPDFNSEFDTNNPVFTGSLSLNRSDTSTIGKNSSTVGYNCSASGMYSHAEGYSNNALGMGAHSEGFQTTAGTIDATAPYHIGSFAHSEGYETSSIGLASHAEGYDSNASGEASHTEGYGTKARGKYSHAGGERSIAEGDYSFAHGLFSKAKTYQTAIGVFNDPSLCPEIWKDNNGYNGTLFVIGNGSRPDAGESNAMRVTGTGAVIAKAAYQSTGADYAEWQEWADGNPDSEDRRGYFVVFDGDKIRKATSVDKNIVGIVSANPCVIGNNDDGWRGKFLMNIFGEYIYEEVEVEREGINPETKEVVINKELVTTYKINPEYNPDMEYIHRKDRPEWDCVGFLGMLIVRMDGTCETNKRCKPNDNGEATLSEDDTGFLVIKADTEHNVATVLVGINTIWW